MDMINRDALKASMKAERESTDKELEEARKELKSLTEGENLRTTLQFPHMLDMDITDAALDKIQDRKSTEFQLFNRCVQVLDYACMRGADPEEGNKTLKLVLKKLTGRHTEEDMVKIQASLTDLTEILKEPQSVNEATSGDGKNDAQDVLSSAMKKFQNNVQNNIYQQMRNSYSR